MSRTTLCGESARYLDSSASEMTSYGGDTSLPGSPARARWYRSPGVARTSAIGASPELDVPEVRHAVHLAEPGQDVSLDRVVDGQDHHRVPARTIASDLHARDVHVVLAEDGAEPPDHPGPVFVAADQEAAVGHQVDPKRVDPNCARLSHQHGAGDFVPVDAKRDEAPVAAVRRASPLDELHTAAGCDQARVDLVDAVLGERLQHAFDRGGDEQVDVVLGELSLEVELDGADPPAEELRVQRGQAFCQAGERTQVGELFWRKRRRVDRV